MNKHSVSREWALKAAVAAFRINGNKVVRHDLVKRRDQQPFNTEAAPCRDPAMLALIDELYAMPAQGKAYLPGNAFKRIRRDNANRRSRQRNGNMDAKPCILETITAKSNKNIMFDMLYGRAELIEHADDAAVIETIEEALRNWTFDRIAGNLKQPGELSRHKTGWNEAVLEVAQLDPVPTKAFTILVHAPLLATRDAERRAWEKRVATECVGFPGSVGEHVKGEFEIRRVTRRGRYGYATADGIMMQTAKRNASDGNNDDPDATWIGVEPVKYPAWFYVGIGYIKKARPGDVISVTGKVGGVKPGRNVVLTEPRLDKVVIE